MPDRPAVTVALPLFNGAAYVDEAIDSVLNQAGWEVHLVVVDDGSTDEGPRKVATRAASDARVELITFDRNRGVAVARNAAVAARAEPLVAMIDQDDRWRPNRLEAGWQALSRDASLGFVLGHQNFERPAGPLPTWFRERWLDGPQAGHVFGTMLAHRHQGWDAVGPLDPGLAAGTDDVDWFARAKDLGVPHLMLDEVLLDRRVHTENASAHTDRSTNELLAIVRSKLHRRDDSQTEEGETRNG